MPGEYDDILSAEREKCRRYDFMLQKARRRASVSPSPHHHTHPPAPPRSHSTSPSPSPVGTPYLPSSVSPSRASPGRLPPSYGSQVVNLNQPQSRAVSPPRHSAVATNIGIQKLRAYQRSRDTLTEDGAAGLRRHAEATLLQARRLLGARETEVRASINNEADRFVSNIVQTLRLCLEEHRGRCLVEEWYTSETTGLVTSFYNERSRAQHSTADRLNSILYDLLSEMEETQRKTLQKQCEEHTMHLKGLLKGGAGERTALELEREEAGVRGGAVDEEMGERSAIARRMIGAEKHLQQLSILQSAEHTGRKLVGNVQRIALDTLDHTEQLQRKGIRILENVHTRLYNAETYNRTDVINFESALRGSMQANFFRCLKLIVSGDTYFTSLTRLVYNIEQSARHEIYAAFHDSLSTIFGTTQNFNTLDRAESRSRELIDSEYWEQLQALSRSYQSTSETTLLFEQAKHVVQREETSARSTLRAQCNQGYKDLLTAWEGSVKKIFYFSNSLTSLIAAETADRSALSESCRDNLCELYSHLLEQEHCRIATALQHEASLQNVQLLSILHFLNAFREDEAKKMWELETLESTKRRDVVNAEAADRAELLETCAMFSQRFSLDHGLLMIVATEGKERRSLEWHEVALRNAVNQYYNDTLTSVDAKARNQSQLLDTLSKESRQVVRFSPPPPSQATPISPEFSRATPYQNVRARSASASIQPPPYPQLPPPEPSEERKLDTLMERLGSVRERLREKVHGGGGGGGGYAAWSPFKIVEELYSVYDEDLFLPEVNEAFLVAVHSIVSRGSMTQQEEAGLGHLAAMMLGQLEQINPDEPRIHQGAARTLNKVYTLLNLLVGL